MNSVEATRTTEPTGSGPERAHRLGRLGAWCYDHRRIVLLGWIIGLIAVIGLASTLGSRFEDDFGGAGQSQQARELLRQRFPTQLGDTARVVFHASGSLDGSGGRIDNALDMIRPLPSVVTSSWAASRSAWR
ncbi:hypothetical protein [Nocardia aurantia]|uniref:Membrane transport protein MMPL domain-containing protein n=1 Tax=Nocardia aurantia TaxID=2585199 RepID=A0A7K0DZV5_9NOCA|nr:hypothetical protein [Nocardia aurantia]MQY31360.1 hypothetical protein [Nocardia aurantia]